MPTVSFTTSGVLQKSALRQANDRLVLDAIRRNPGISRSEIARISGFSRTSVTYVVNRLLRSRLVTEERVESVTGSGRPPTRLRLRAEAMTAIGVEISRPDSSVILVDLNGEILEQRSVAWRENPQLFLDEVAGAIRAVGTSRNPRRVLGVGVSLPGTIEKSSGRVLGAEGIGWFDVEVGKRLRSRVDWPLFFENDANLSALAEQWYSPANGDVLRYFVYMRMQGGLGSGVVVDGRILHGVSAAGAELGHIMLYPDGRPCNCGNRGCWEQYASDAALVRAYRELAGETGGEGKIIDESLRIVKLARAGDEHALGALRTTATYLALGFVSVIAALNPQAIILGEPMASAWDLVEDVVHAELRQRVPPYYLNGLRLLPSRIDTNSALRGAAALALAHFFTRFDHTKDDALPNGVAMVAHG
jgi:predicted NBD/HSP70 family sugar kinase